MEIPDAIFRRAEATAAQQGRQIGEYVAEALVEKLAGQGRGWQAAVGTLSPEGQRAAREVDAMIADADFNKIDPEVWA